MAGDRPPSLTGTTWRCFAKPPQVGQADGRAAGQQFGNQIGSVRQEPLFSGVRDRDDRYSFRGLGGPLRAGPSLGWHAVGYDLCYDGWDKTTREKFGRALADVLDALEQRAVAGPGKTAIEESLGCRKY